MGEFCQILASCAPWTDIGIVIVSTDGIILVKFCGNPVEGIGQIIGSVH